MIPSCIAPRTFAAFSNHAEPKPPQAFGQTSSSAEWLTDKDGQELFHSDGIISVKRAGAFFAAGFLATYAGAGLLRKLKGAPEKATKEARQVVEKALHNESQTYLNFQNPLLSLYTMAIKEPEFKQVFVTYSIATALGYLSTNLMQGLQEAWVRREETEIRAKLLARMNTAFQQSIRIKQGYDNGLMDRARQQIRDLLQAHQVKNVEALMDEAPWTEPHDMNRLFYYEPTHRTKTQLRFGEGGRREFSDYLNPPFVKVLDGLFLASGAALGLLVRGIGKTISGFSRVLKTNVDVDKMIKSISLYDSEALLALSRKLNSKMLVLSYGGLVGVAAAGKLLVDGLREIEVTRVHAATEYRYQHHNWTVLDPSFHRIAEDEALNDELSRLAKDLPRLKRRPDKLRQRIQAVLTNIGRNSAPKYFPMTPPVGLVVARS